MADNTVLPPGVGGDTIRDVDKGGLKTQVILLDVGGLGAESLFTGHIIVDTLPATASTAANQATEIASLASIDGKITTVNTGAIAGSVTANAGSNLNTSLLALEGGHLASIDTSTAKIPSQGQAMAANSMPVVLPATQITTLIPPAAITGFALEAGHLANLDTNTPTLGQKAMVGSSPVTLASDQPAIPVSATSLPLPSGAALEAGNLTSVVSLNLQLQQLLELQRSQVGLLQSMNLHLALITGANFSPQEFLNEGLIH